MFDEEDREIGYALFLAIGVAILVSIFTIGMAAGSAIGQFGSKPKAEHRDRNAASGGGGRPQPVARRQRPRRS